MRVDISVQLVGVELKLVLQRLRRRGVHAAAKVGHVRPWAGRFIGFVLRLHAFLRLFSHIPPTGFPCFLVHYTCDHGRARPCACRPGNAAALPCKRPEHARHLRHQLSQVAKDARASVLNRCRQLGTVCAVRRDGHVPTEQVALSQLGWTSYFRHDYRRPRRESRTGVAIALLDKTRGACFIRRRQSGARSSARAHGR